MNLSDISQLFNSMDPSPFNERDLDKDAEEFILGWAREYAHHEPVSLVIELKQFPEGDDLGPMVEQAVRNNFAYRARLNTLEFRRLMQQGRVSLLIGLFFLITCLLTSEFLLSKTPGTLTNLTRESLTIAGWVAMWRPIEIYLYDWWPLQRRGQTFEKLSKIAVTVHKKDAHPGLR